jgi:hypothetical protein
VQPAECHNAARAMSTPDNPFAPPRADNEAPPNIDPASPHAQRTALLRYERLIRYAGYDLLAIGIICFINDIPRVLFGGAPTNFLQIPATLWHGIYAVVDLACVAAGIGIVRYEPWSRSAGLAVAAAFVFRFPLGTAFAAVIAKRLLSKNSRQIFTAEHAAIRSATPELNPKYPLVRVLIGIALLLVLFWVVYQIISAENAANR